MKRLAYLRTVRGQQSQYERRLFARRRFRIEQPLRSKNSMKAADKVAFQMAVFDDLERFKKPTFRAPLIAELTFYSNQNDPPQLHTLAKNYLDLLGPSLHLPTPGRRHLVYRDDRQVKVLSVSYHLYAGREASAILIDVGRLSDLRQDLALVERIRRGEFARDEDAWPSRGRPEPSPRFDDVEERASDKLDEAFRNYRDVKKDGWGRGLAPDVVELMREMERQHVQERYLEWNELVVRRTVLKLFAGVPRGDGFAEIRDAAANMDRQILMSEPITLDLAHAPAASGDSAVFRDAVVAALDAFSKRRPWLFPLRVPVSATILVVPPPNGIDLDNLARKIVPLIHDKWQPPRSQLARVDAAQIPDARLRGLITAQLGAEKRFPRTALTRYEVVELPRARRDPSNGFVRVALGSGSATTLRDTIDKTIEEWSESID